VAPSLHHDNVAARIYAFSRGKSANGKSPKLWLLGPVRVDQFKPIACLRGFNDSEYDSSEQLCSKGLMMSSLKAKQ
jgi:hypothetical protein